MSEQLYNVVFQGQLAEGASADEVKQKLANLFKINIAQAASMLSGKPVFIKKKVDINTAKKYQMAMQKAGTVAAILPLDDATVAPAKAAKPNQAVSQVNNKTSAPASSAVVLPGNQAKSEIPDTKAPQTSVSLNTNADLSGISMADAGAELQSAKAETAEPDFDLSGIDLAAVGEAILSKGTDQAPLNIDTGNLSLE